MKKKKGVGLKEIEDAFNEYKNYLELEESDKNDLDEIVKAIADPTKYKDKPITPPVTEVELKRYFGDIDNLVDETLANKWGNSGIVKTNIKGIIEKACKDDKKSPKDEFINHLKSEGLADGTKLNEKDDANKIWREFLKKEPEQVANTIHTHWLETGDNKNATKKEMKDKVKSGTSGDDEEKLDLTSYGATEKDGDPDDKGIVKYLLQKAKDSGFEYYKVKEKDENGGNGNGKKLEGAEAWFAFRKDNWKKPLFTYSMIILGVLAIAAFIFWNTIVEWWNGPAEEQGEGKVDEGEKKDEEE